MRSSFQSMKALIACMNRTEQPLFTQDEEVNMSIADLMWTMWPGDEFIRQMCCVYSKELAGQMVLISRYQHHRVQESVYVDLATEILSRHTSVPIVTGIYPDGSPRVVDSGIDDDPYMQLLQLLRHPDVHPALPRLFIQHASSGLQAEQLQRLKQVLGQER